MPTATKHERKISARRLKISKLTEEKADFGTISAKSADNTWESDVIESRLRELANYAVNFDSEAERARLQALRHSVASKANVNPQSTKKASITYIFILSVFILITTIGSMLLQSYLLSSKYVSFPMPILASAIVFAVQAVFGAVALMYFGVFTLSIKELFSNRQGWKLFLAGIVPCSVITAVEAALTQVAFKMVTVSFFTMVKASSLIFMLIGAFLIGQEKPHLTLFAVILITALGVGLAAWDPNSTNGVEWVGFGLVLLASLSNAVKWMLTEVLLNRSQTMSDCVKRINNSGPNAAKNKNRNLLPLFSVFLLAPVTLVMLLLSSFVLEDLSRQSLSASLEVTALGLILILGVSMFLIRVVEFRYVQLVSVVTLAILGIIRQVILIATSMALLGDIVNTVNVIGLLVTIIGVVLYNYYRVQEAKNSETAMRSAFEVELDSLNQLTESLKIQKARQSHEDCAMLVEAGKNQMASNVGNNDTHYPIK